MLLSLRNSVPFFKIFSPTKHYILLSTFTVQNPDGKSNNYAIPPNQPSPSSTEEIGITHLFNRSSTFSRTSTFSDVISSNKIITRYVRSGDLDSALGVFNGMTVKTTVTWNSILAGISKEPGKTSEAQELFGKIPEPDIVSYNIMLSCYLRSSDVETARSFFNRMPVKDTASWNTMISGFARKGKMIEARQLFMAMPDKNSVTWSAMISGYVECGKLDMAAELFEVAPVKSVVTWTAMINGYMKFGKVESAERLFRDIPVKNLVTWNAMIAGYVENYQAENGLKLFRAMLACGIRPNSSSLSSVLLGCSELSALQLGKQVHQVVYKSPFCNDTTAGTSLISMYCKCGNIGDAWKLFMEMPVKDTVTWNAMISGYAQHGEGERAIRLFDEMRDKGLKPDWISFVAVLLACNHAGLANLGIQYFDLMVRDYGVEARPDHYTCMVDLLGRAGKLLEAIDLIKKMPFKPRPAIFGTLLGACRIHKNLEVAEYAAKSLLNLDPTSAVGYVQLANVYAAMNRWDDVAKVHKAMKENRIVKTPGYSWIEVGSVEHEFRSVDRIHAN